MLLIRYPTKSIAILTPYKGQKELLIDIALKRCSWNPIFGMPIIEVVSDFQSHQSDIVLVSLVRTKSPGILADIGQYVTAMSAAKRGLYLFGRLKTFEKVHSFANGFKIVSSTTTKGLELLPNETFDNQTRLQAEKVKNPTIFSDCIQFGKFINDLIISKIK